MAKKPIRTFADIQKQIAALEAEAEMLRQSEKTEVIDKIKVAIAHYGITAGQLGFGKGGKAAQGARATKTAKPAQAVVRKPVPVKYRDEQGNTWTGRGNKPRWLAAALAQGKSIDDFLLKA